MSDPRGKGGHGSLKSYLTGFALSVILTVIPFWIVMGEAPIPKHQAIAAIVLLGGLQMIVHIHYFLHVTIRAEDGWQAMSMGLTILLLVIVLSGSVWVMFNLESHMMPDYDQIERVRNLP